MLQNDGEMQQKQDISISKTQEHHFSKVLCQTGLCTKKNRIEIPLNFINLTTEGRVMTKNVSPGGQKMN